MKLKTNPGAAIVKLGWGIFTACLGVYCILSGGQSVKEVFSREPETPAE